MKGFVNPYNFIGFPENKARAYTDEDRHTGVIEYKITTKTPLFIPNSSSDKAFKESDYVPEHKSYDFFSYTELDGNQRYEGEYYVPVIPGSEMRGVVRSVYETLTDSCLGLLNEETYPVKRSAEAFKPALLYRDPSGKIVLYEAKSYRIGSPKQPQNNRRPAPDGFEDMRNGMPVCFAEPLKDDKGQPKPISTYVIKDTVAQDSRENTGYLLKWGMGVKKSRYHVFVAGKSLGIQLTRENVERQLMDLIASYLDQPAVLRENQLAYEEYEKDLINFLRGKGTDYFPVNYSKLTLNSRTLYLSPAVFTKEVSAQSIGSLAKEFAPCKENYCPACDLFGYVGKNNESSKGSSIRFTDLYVDKGKEDKSPEDYYACDKLTIQTLGEPKLGNVDFYLKKPQGANYWTYDYYIKGNGKINIQEGMLRGRKYYWHHRNPKVPAGVEATKLNKTIRPLKSNVTFIGKLYFEGISKKQLVQLIWILNSGTEKLGLKLGGAKPLGFGSIACEVTGVKERIIAIEDGKVVYRIEETSFGHSSYEDAGFSKTVKDEFYKIAGLETVPKDVEITYPKEVAQKNKPLTEGYKWFVNNHTTTTGKMARSRSDVVIREVLPSIQDEDFSLPYNRKPENQKNKNTGYSNYGGNKGGYRKSGNKKWK